TPSILEALPCGRQSLQTADEIFRLGDIDREFAGVDGDPWRVALPQRAGELRKRRSAHAPADSFSRDLARPVLEGSRFDGNGVGDGIVRDVQCRFGDEYLGRESTESIAQHESSR